MENISRGRQKSDNLGGALRRGCLNKNGGGFKTQTSVPLRSKACFFFLADLPDFSPKKDIFGCFKRNLRKCTRLFPQKRYLWLSFVVSVEELAQTTTPHLRRTSCMRVTHTLPCPPPSPAFVDQSGCFCRGTLLSVCKTLP